MYYCSKNFTGDSHFISAGIFMSKDSWIHSSRIIDSYEIICGIEGTLPMEVDNEFFEIEAGQMMIIPPGVPHKGFKQTQGTIRFLWFHFSLDTVQSLDQQEAQQLLTDDFCPNQLLLLPNYHDKLNMNRLYLMINQLLDLYQDQVVPPYIDAYLNSILYEITHQTMQLLKSSLLENDTLQPIQDWIRIHAFEKISLQSIANHFNYNKNYLSRKYKNETGIGITMQITKHRIDQAKLLLAESNLSIEEIAAYVGYDDAKYFMRTFRKFENMTPTQYRFTFNKRHFNKV